jgi:ribosomal protein S18 acetylase RimI-like enzyme
VLRPAVARDVELLAELARRPGIADTLSTDAPAELERALGDDAGELLVIEHDGVVAGGVRWVLVNRRSAIGDVRTLMLDPAFRGRGLATAAVVELAARLFRERRLHRLEAEVYGFNVAAQRVFDRAGFVREGTRRQAYDRAGAWQDGVRFGLLADEFVAYGAPRPATDEGASDG